MVEGNRTVRGVACLSKGSRSAKMMLCSELRDNSKLSGEK